MKTILKFISDHTGKIVGTTLASFLVRIVIALLAFYTGAATDAGDAFGIAVDKQRSIATAVELINETPREEVAEAVEEEKAESGQ
jgi:hypothetical protein